MIYIQSRTGGRAENQDFYGNITTKFGELIVVCDGMGGHLGGKHASELAVKNILEQVKNSTESEPTQVLLTALQKANTEIFNEGQTQHEYRNMGTTAVALLITADKAISCHIGDSRIYQLRNNEIIFRTSDHSQVFELVKAGVMTEEEARISSQSNIITRALGIKPIVEIDITDNLQYQVGDRFLLCTDGIWGVLPEHQLIELVTQTKDITTTVNQTIDVVEKIGSENGGKHDNLTIALAEIDSNSDFKSHKATSKKSLFSLIKKFFRKKTYKKFGE